MDLGSRLEDVPSDHHVHPTTVVFNDQYSFNTPNQSFTLGGTDGDGHTLTGSLTGNLLAGHTYRWHYLAYIQAPTGGDDGASASGAVTLKIAEATVPEPSFILTFAGLALCSGAAGWRRKRRRQSA